MDEFYDLFMQKNFKSEEKEMFNLNKHIPPSVSGKSDIILKFIQGIKRTFYILKVRKETLDQKKFCFFFVFSRQNRLDLSRT